VETPFVDELVRRLRYDDPGAEVDITEGGSATVSFRPPGLDHWVILQLTERDLAKAVSAIGEECRDDIWPGSTIEVAGFNLLLVHVDEVIATRDTTEPLRILPTGLEWPEDRPQ
jgi:hypothetical protein